MKKISEKQKGTLFLFILSTFIWALIGISNHHGLLESIISGAFLGAISTLLLVILFIFLKNTYNW